MSLLDDLEPLDLSPVEHKKLDSYYSKQFGFEVTGYYKKGEKIVVEYCGLFSVENHEYTQSEFNELIL